ncbi:MAG: HAMP domain-containing histidine kinase [Deltaproteobacteria bacterium]|nr:HAMP domain-containing histidine kinase [Deltaproteobacteria bacterium]
MQQSRDISNAETAWLVRLRWLAVAGQSVLALGGAQLVTGLPVAWLFFVVALIAASNLLLSRVAPSRVAVGTVIVGDVVALTALLYLSGGANNPFGFFYVVHVALAAILLGERWTWSIAALSALCYGALFFVYVELPELSSHGMHHTSSFSLHLQGMWFAFSLVAATLAFFFTRFIRAINAQAEQLREAQERALRSERLAAVTALGANAAHELNTPLGTIRLAAEEMVRALDGQPGSLAEDARLILSEVRRCSGVLAQLRRDGGEIEGEAPRTIRFADLCTELMERMPLDRRTDVTVDAQSRDVLLSAPIRPLMESLSALVKNALEASPDAPVVLSATRSATHSIVTVTDRGVGIPVEILRRVGEPFFTTKAVGSGLGLGVFLAQSFVEKIGGRLDLSSQPGIGTRVILKFPSEAQ